MIAVTNHWQFEKYWPFEMVHPSAMFQPRIAEHDVVVIAPKGTTREWWCDEIVRWKAAGKLPLSKLVFGTYYGRYYREPEISKWVDGYVVHCRSDIITDKDEFVPLALTSGPPRGLVGEYIFVGGRKERDFVMAYNAIRPRWQGVFVSDFLPQIATVKPNIHWLRERVPLSEYKRLIDNSILVVVPVKPGGYPHGHSDVVRGLLAGKPVVVTAGASCDDYIDGKNGIACEYSTGGLMYAIRQVLANLPEYRRHCEGTYYRYTPERYIQNLVDMINRRCGTEYAHSVKEY